MKVKYVKIMDKEGINKNEIKKKIKEFMRWSRKRNKIGKGEMNATI